MISSSLVRTICGLSLVTSGALARPSYDYSAALVARSHDDAQMAELVARSFEHELFELEARSFEELDELLIARNPPAQTETSQNPYAIPGLPINFRSKLREKAQAAREKVKEEAEKVANGGLQGGQASNTRQQGLTNTGNVNSGGLHTRFYNDENMGNLNVRSLEDEWLELDDLLLARDQPQDPTGQLTNMVSSVKNRYKEAKAKVQGLGQGNSFSHITNMMSQAAGKGVNPGTLMVPVVRRDEMLESHGLFSQRAILEDEDMDVELLARSLLLSDMLDEEIWT